MKLPPKNVRVNCLSVLGILLLFTFQQFIFYYNLYYLREVNYIIYNLIWDFSIDISKKCPFGRRNTCQENPQIKVRKDAVSGATDYGYVTHEKLAGQWIGGLKYGNKPLRIENGETFGRSEVVTVYYHEDGDRTNVNVPLILGVKETRGGNYEWYENTGDGIKWKTISNTAEFPSNDTGQVNSRFKDKLDRLACKLQGIVEINLSKDKDEEYCHHGHERGYNEKIRVKLNPDTFSFPNYVLFEHTPNSGTELTIGGFNIGGTPQTGFSGLKFPFKATKITVFMPACDHNNPFLLHIASGDNNGKWFKNIGGSIWEEHIELRGQAPDEANDQIVRDFETLTSDIGIRPCAAPSNPVQLDVNKIPSPNKNETVYFSCKTPILVEKVLTSTNGFFKLVHTTAKTPFQLETYLFNGQEIRKTKGTPGQPITDVNSVSVYYWDGDDNKPILLEVASTVETKHYSYRFDTGVRKNNWSHAGNSDKSLEYLLDDQNCNRNGAIPFEINDPTTAYASYGSHCIKETRKITDSASSPTFIPESDYIIKEYYVHSSFNIGTQISRATFGGKDTSGIKLPRSYTVSKIRVFSYPDSGSDIPLMLEFMPKDTGGQSEWYYSQRSNGLTWAKLGNRSTVFYKEDKPTEALTTALDEVRCLHNSEITMNLSLDNDMQYTSGESKYCCTYHSPNGGEPEAKVSVKRGEKVASTIPYYKHEIKLETKLAGIKYNDGGTSRKNITLSGSPFPIEGSLSVYVFYCYKGNPVLIYLDSPSDSGTKGWYKKDKDDSRPWTKLKGVLPENGPDNIKGCGDDFNKLVAVLRDFGCPYNDCTNPSTQPLSQGGNVSLGPQLHPLLPGAVSRSKNSELSWDLFLSATRNFGKVFVDVILPNGKTPENTTKPDTPALPQQPSQRDQTASVGALQSGDSSSGRESNKGDTSADNTQGVSEPEAKEVTQVQTNEAQNIGLTPPAVTPQQSHGPPAEALKQDGTSESTTTTGGPTAAPKVTEAALAPTSTKSPPKAETATTTVLPSQSQAISSDSTTHETQKSQVSALSPGYPAQTSSTWTSPEKIIPTVLTGVGVVSGSLTGFGWWIYKRSKGDPWVRQI
ncbi:hypothetical protein BEWA_036500 [Theileria equi strain WA]|uniref:Uncharacterized protein n=1 Tax=Theileria equi strain WA TaxID=1537102 RepID=L1LEA1_THEEQ|nr:hypothetical protein BEWA_036500 [Theileria equi strain WA]EKX73614.1 hypothetical protein BEWA_036500 [Theileria equi strain WA]|eukprot:XP_004833066.1 hypothetical protein BEWA_036500 [Theileria equi strain WA]